MICLIADLIQAFEKTSLFMRSVKKLESKVPTMYKEMFVSNVSTHRLRSASDPVTIFLVEPLAQTDSQLFSALKCTELHSACHGPPRLEKKT